jgi:hypothetical protein
MSIFLSVFIALSVSPLAFCNRVTEFSLASLGEDDALGNDAESPSQPDQDEALVGAVLKSPSQDEALGEKLLAIHDHMSGIEQLKIKKDPTYQALWPRTCVGKNAAGEQLALEAEHLDGFACEEEGGEKIASVTELLWKAAGHPVCCDGRCQPHQPPGSKCEAKTLAQAARIAALGVYELRTESDKAVGVETQEEAPGTPDAQRGLISTVRLLVRESLIQFKQGSDELSPDAMHFLIELAHPLSIFLSLQLVAHENARFLFCVHASTTKTDAQMEAFKGTPWENLPTRRAETLKGTLQLPSDRVTKGDAIGHNKHEQGTSFDGGRDGSIIFQVYEGETTPECHRETLYRFAKP